MKAQVVSFRCVLKDKLGRIISSSFNSEVLNQSNEGSASLPGLVAGLQNVKKGEKRNIFVPAEEAYGLYDPELVLKVRRRELGEGSNLEIGDEIVTESVDDGHARTFRVIETQDEFLVIDGNHPLAGQDLTCEIEVTAARDAVAEDLGEPTIIKHTEYVH